jgi:hypothetical protein
MLVAHPSLNVRTVKEMLTPARERSDKLLSVQRGRAAEGTCRWR